MKSDKETIAFARDSLGLSQAAEIELSIFEGRGSDRTYFRLKWNRRHSAIVVRYEATRVENSYYAGIAAFLIEIGVAVPQIIRHDPVEGFIIMQDLGDTDLWLLRSEPWSLRRILYQKTLVIVHRLHSYPEHHFPFGRVKLMEAFGPGLYRWERDYFRENFVQGVCGIALEPRFNQELETELAALAERLDSRTRCLVHRDLQSQNVMIWQEEPFLIDFQGMRFGTVFYDLGSLLCDPYVNLSQEERRELLSCYYGLSKNDLGWDCFQNAFWEASAQRLMQALGTYGYLGLSRGLRRYLVHIPAALRNLRAAAENASSLPRLLELSSECERSPMRLSIEAKNELS